MASNIIGLDPGAKFGWALLDGDGAHIDSGTWLLKGTLGQRLTMLDHCLSLLVTDGALLAYEKVRRHLGADAAHAYGAYEGIIHLVAQRRGLDLVAVPVQVAKKTATGKGNAKKPAMTTLTSCFGMRPGGSWEGPNDKSKEGCWNQKGGMVSHDRTIRRASKKDSRRWRASDCAPRRAVWGQLQVREVRTPSKAIEHERKKRQA